MPQLLHFSFFITSSSFGFGKIQACVVRNSQPKMGRFGLIQIKIIYFEPRQIGKTEQMIAQIPAQDLATFGKACATAGHDLLTKLGLRKIQEPIPWDNVIPQFQTKFKTKLEKKKAKKMVLTKKRKPAKKQYVSILEVLDELVAQWQGVFSQEYLMISWDKLVQACFPDVKSENSEIFHYSSTTATGVTNFFQDLWGKWLVLRKKTGLLFSTTFLNKSSTWLKSITTRNTRMIILRRKAYLPESILSNVLRSLSLILTTLKCGRIFNKLDNGETVTKDVFNKAKKLMDIGGVGKDKKDQQNHYINGHESDQLHRNQRQKIVWALQFEMFRQETEGLSWDASSPQLISALMKYESGSLAFGLRDGNFKLPEDVAEEVKNRDAMYAENNTCDWLDKDGVLTTRNKVNETFDGLESKPLKQLPTTQNSALGAWQQKWKGLVNEAKNDIVNFYVNTLNTVYGMADEQLGQSFRAHYNKAERKIGPLLLWGKEDENLLKDILDLLSKGESHKIDNLRNN